MRATNWPDVASLADEAREIGAISPLVEAIKSMCAMLEAMEERVIALAECARSINEDAERRNELVLWAQTPAGQARLREAMREADEFVEADPGIEDQAARDEALDAEILPGEYRTDMSTGNPFRLDHVDESRPDRVWLTDPLGRVDLNVSRADWETWPLDESAR